MYPFEYLRAESPRAAIEAASQGGRFIAGRTTLVDLMREKVERPETLVDISDLPLRRIRPTPRGGR